MSDALDFSAKREVLAVDDTPDNLSVISGALRDEFTVKVATSGERALQICLSASPPDLVLLDIMMPDMDGYEVLRRLNSAREFAGIPVIFVTALDQEQDEQIGLDLGAVDYITKPISPAILRARVRTHLLLKEARDHLKDEKRTLQTRLGETQVAAMQAIASLAELRDDETPRHILRMQGYVRTLAGFLSDHPRFNTLLAEGRLDLLVESVAVHDIGKVAMSDRVLHGGDSLEGAELEEMKTHPVIGRDVLDRVQYRVGGDAGLLALARDIVYCHHERWDGRGYPQGLKGEAIPLAARLVALADVYDALTSRRPYYAPVPHAEAAETIVMAKGSHFDPAVVDAFLQAQAQFREIAATYADSEADVAALEALRRGRVQRIGSI